MATVPYIEPASTDLPGGYPDEDGGGFFDI